MKTLSIIAILFSSAPTAGEVHKDAVGPSTVCGVTADNAQAFQIAVRDSGPYSLLNQNENYFTVISDDALTIWGFTMPNSSEPSAAICSRLIKHDDGSISGQFSIRCDGTREACENVYREWLEYHKKNTVSRVTKIPKANHQNK